MPRGKIVAYRPPEERATNRRSFLALLGAGTLTAAAGGTELCACGRKPGGKGAATNARDVAAVLPSYSSIEFLKPDIPGEGPIPSGYLKYPSHLVDAIPDRPGKSGRAIRTMSAAWGPTPPGLGRNSFLKAVNERLGVPVNPSVQDGNGYADKLSAMLGARDVPDLLSAPMWEIDKIPRFSQAVKALFADLTEYLQGDKAFAYPMLAALPTSAWQYSVWGGRLAAVPFPPDGPFPWALFYRKDLTDRAGVAAPKTIDELYDFGRKMTDAVRGVWAFGTIFDMVQMFFKCPHSKGGWRRKASGGLEFKYEIPEFGQALEFTSRLYRDGMVHPDLVATRGGDAGQLFDAGKIIAREDGLGTWRASQSEQARVTPGYDIQPMPVFSAIGGPPLAWGSSEPMFYTFVKKGLGKERTEEILRVLNWCAAPFGSKEYELSAYGVEGTHFTRAADGSPIPTDLGRRELASQYVLLGGRVAAVVGTADVPNFVGDLLGYLRTTAPYIEPDPFAGIKLELPANYSKLQVSTEDKIGDVVRGRRPLGDLDAIVREWRNSGGDEGRAFLEKALGESGR